MLRAGFALTSSVLFVSTLIASACSNEADDCKAIGTCNTTAGTTAGGTAAGGGGSGDNAGASPGGTTGVNEAGTAAGGVAGSSGGAENTIGGEAGVGAGGGAAGTGVVTVPCDGACDVPTPVCDQPSNTCVECLEPGDCLVGNKTKCDPDAKACVECLETDDCTTAAAAKCDGGNCAKCTANADCAHIAGKNVCDTVAGECVQCTGTDYAACGMDAGTPLVCDSKARACSTKKKGSAGLCQSCVADAQCTAGELCVEEKFGATRQSVGFFCFYKKGDTANGAPADCETLGRPYATTLVDQTSIDGTSADVCGLRSSSCVARNQLSSKDCATASAADDSKCGFATGEDSKCRPFGAGFRCTMRCISDEDCVSGSSCLTGVNPAVCKL